MPGFAIGGQGGDIPDGPANIIETRRKHRWRFSAMEGNIPASNIMLVLQKASRPKQNFEEVVMHHNQEEAYFAGKTKWDAITLGFYDAQQPADCSAAMWEWIDSVVTPGINTANVNYPNTYKKLASLEMIDGLNVTNETWKLYGSWPQSTNWQDLDYTSSEIAMIEVTMRFDRAIREPGLSGS